MTSATAVIPAVRGAERLTEKVVVTGAEGFLGWHVRVRARASGHADPVPVTRSTPERLASLIDGADRVVHLAGANRGSPADVSAGNLRPARQLAEALRACPKPPRTVVFANSIQAGNNTPYGESKAASAALLAEASNGTGSTFVDLRLPNVFGEHGRPRYNSVVATFCRQLADGATPTVEHDRLLDLVHAADAAALLLGLASEVTPAQRTVRQLAQRLSGFARVYRRGDIPDLADQFDVRLFNTYRSHLFPAGCPVPLVRHADYRGDLLELVRAQSGGGQTFISTTRPGVTRGEHYHLAKIERFVVLRGEAMISLRRVLGDEVHRFRVSGTEPVAVDMPAMWVHNLTNVGQGELVTLFWANEVFDPAHPDTYAEAVS